MNSAQRFLANEPLKGLDAEGELADREGSLAAKMTIAEVFQVWFRVVVRAEDDAQILTASAFNRGLVQALLAIADEIEWLAR